MLERSHPTLTLPSRGGKAVSAPIELGPPRRLMESRTPVSREGSREGYNSQCGAIVSHGFAADLPPPWGRAGVGAHPPDGL